MKSIQKSCLFALFLVMFAMMNIETGTASNLTPIVLWQINGTARVGFPIEFVCRSWDNDGYIAARQWYRDGTPISTSDRISFTETLAEGEVSKTVTIQLKVKDDKGLWSELRTSVLTYTKSGQSEYYLTDHLGSIRTTIDQTGTVIGYDDYDPFGNVLPGRSSNLGTPNDLNKFTGHERDQEGGLDLDYMLARNYDSELGRFYSVDPLHYKYHSTSPYAYVLNNPINANDPTGEWANFVVGAIVGAVVEAGSQVANSMSNKVSFIDAVSNIDGGDVFTAAVFGAATAGIGTIKNLAKGVKTGVTIAANVTEGAVKAGTGSQTEEYGIGNTAADLLGGASGKIVGDVGKTLSGATQVGQQLGKVAKTTGDRAARLGSNTAQKAANQAKSAFNNHQDMMGILPSGVASSTTSNGVKAVVNGTSSQTGSGTTQVQTNSGSSSAPNDNTRTVIKRKG